MLGSEPRQLLAELALVWSLHRLGRGSAGQPLAQVLARRISIKLTVRQGSTARLALAEANSGFCPTCRRELRSHSRPNPAHLLDKVTLMCHTASPFNHARRVTMTLAAHLAELSEKHRLLENKIREEM